MKRKRFVDEGNQDEGLRTTLGALVRQEQDLTWNGYERLGPIFTLSQRAVALLNTFVVKVDENHHFAAALMLSIHKSTNLAFLSILRKHLAQSQLNERMVIEYTSLTAYMLAHPDAAMIEPESDGPARFVPFKKVSQKAYGWLEGAFPDQSARLRERKSAINDMTSHASIFGSHFTFNWNESDGEKFIGSFFDLSEKHVEQAALLAFVQTTITVILTIGNVAMRFGGFVIHDGTAAALRSLANDTEAYAADLAGDAHLWEAP